MIKQLIAASFACTMSSAVQAECVRALTMTFTESAPRDRFDIIHTATGVVLESIRIDLANSAGGLIFDTENGGAGVEVFQPFESADGLTTQAIADGAEVIDFRVGALQTGSRTGFSIDVDDRKENSDLGQIRVTGGELQGASVLFMLANGDALEAVFDKDNRAKVCS